MDTASVYADIVKHERNQDGDLVVYGRATGPDLDLDQQICDPAFLKTAIPAWFATGANVREQHSSVAAGVGQEITETADGGWDLKALVVDPVSARKFEKGVLKGYSIGIRSPKVVKDAAAPGGRIVAGQVVEISLVDRPANPTCTLMLAKAAKPGMTVKPGDLDADRMLVKVEELHEAPDTLLKVVEAGGDSGDVEKRQFSDKERARLANSGAALPDGSFPIQNVADLRNAIHAIGRAKDPEKAKAHIKARARALGKENLIPDSWKSADADVAKAAPDGMYVHDPAQLAQIRNSLVALIKAELDELDDGDRELCDIQQLLCSLAEFLCWWSDEAADGETQPPYTGDDMSGGPLMAVNLSAEADTTKTAGVCSCGDGCACITNTAAKAAGKAPSKKDPDGDVDRGEDGMDADEDGDGDGKKKSSKGADADVAALVKDAVAAAMAPLVEALTPKNAETSADAEKAVDADEKKTPDLTELVKATVAEATAPLQEMVAKALAQPAPGGPVLTRTAEETNKAAAREADLAKAAHFERLAMEVHDPVARQGYLAKAKSLRDAA